MDKKILVVEDTPDLLQNLTEFLVMEGFTVSPCLNAKSAFGKLEQGEIPDLILTDLSMPDMDGFQLIEKIREKKSLDHIPVIIFSARPLQENQARAVSLGVAKYIKKPCPPDELVLSIQEILKGK
jgi:DNA-binding response OmpR family regulator